MNRKQLILIVSSAFLVIALALGGTYAWFTTRSSRQYSSYYIGYGGIGIELKYASYTVKHDGDGVYDDYYDKDGSPIAMPTYIAVGSPWPRPTGSVASPTVAPVINNPNDVFNNRIAFIYPGGMFYDDGSPLDNARGVLEYYVKNISGGDAIVKVNQKGVRFVNQDDPKPDEITDVNFSLYHLKNNFVYYADAPAGIVNPNRQTPVPFINETLLRSMSFSPYDIFNTDFYGTKTVNLVSKEWKAAYTAADYAYTNTFGPDAFGLRLNARAILDAGVKMAANANAECLYFYIPRDKTARLIYSFNALTPTETNSVVKRFTNEYQYSVLALDTTDAASLEAYASQPVQDEFEQLFGVGDSQTVKENFELTEWETRPKQTAAPRQTKTPTPTAANPTRALNATPTKSPTPLPSPSATPTNVPGLMVTDAPTSTPMSTPSNTPTKIPTKTPTKAPTNTPTKTPTNTPTKTPTPTPNCSNVTSLSAPVLSGRANYPELGKVTLTWSEIPCADTYAIYIPYNVHYNNGSSPAISYYNPWVVEITGTSYVFSLDSNWSNWADPSIACYFRVRAWTSDLSATSGYSNEFKYNVNMTP
jgi:hypothetical protein